MKRRRYILLLVSLLMMAVQLRAQQGTEAANGIKFFKGTFSEALVKAKQENKILFVDFYAVWCVPCKKMAKTVFTQEEVGKYFNCLLYTSPSPRDPKTSRMPSSA